MTQRYGSENKRDTLITTELSSVSYFREIILQNWLLRIISMRFREYFP